MLQLPAALKLEVPAASGLFKVTVGSQELGCVPKKYRLYRFRPPVPPAKVKGTPHHRNIPQELTEHGAQPNGSTWYDRTNYVETVPTGALRVATKLVLMAVIV